MQKAAFYLFITMGDKLFRSKEFNTALDVARVSFAHADLMEQMLGTKIGTATVFSALLDTENVVQIVIDKDVLIEALIRHVFRLFSPLLMIVE